jgi:uncharacterized protein
MLVDRNEAFKLLKRYLKKDENIRFALAVEAVMREFAVKLNRDPELWGLTGLLHNVDFEYTAGEPEKRGVLSSQLVEGLLPENGVNAIKANNYIYTDQIPTTSLDKALISTSTFVGFIREIMRTTPECTMNQITLKLVVDRYNDASFSPKFKRSRIQLASDTGMELINFFEMALNRLKKGMVKQA